MAEPVVVDDLRTRVLDATFAEVADGGLGGLTVEGVAVRAGISRATVYRRFPGGRDELIASTVRREVERFLATMVLGAGPQDDAVAHVVGLVMAAHRGLGEHQVLQRLLAEEADQILPPLAVLNPLVTDLLAVHLQVVLDRARALGRLEDGIDSQEAGQHCARVVLSYVGSPGSIDLDDPDAVRNLVEHRVLPGIVSAASRDR